jgi:hypothetical protein
MNYDRYKTDLITIERMKCSAALDERCLAIDKESIDIYS